MKTPRKIMALGGAAALLLSALSCDKEVKPEGETDRKVKVEFCARPINTDVDVTKVTGNVSASENKVKNLQVLVFNKANGRIDAYASANASSLELTCTMGERIAYALVNAPDCKEITHLSELQAKKITYSDNALDAFVMAGSSDVDFDASPVEINVSRAVSRVVVSNIGRNFDSPSLASLEMSLEEVYMMNVPKTSGFFSPDASALRVDETFCPAFLKDAPGAVMKNASYISDKHYFYVMPGNSQKEKMSLVFKCCVGTETLYYKIAVPDLAPNTSYEIQKVTFKRPGTQSDEEYVSTDDVQFSIRIVDWNKADAVSEFEI